MDKYVTGCVKVADDDGSNMGEASHRAKNGDEYYYPVESLPDTPEFPDDLDWMSIDEVLMYRILTFSIGIRDANSGAAWPPDYDEMFKVRQVGFGGD